MTTMFGTMTVHAAVIEWDEGVDPSIFVANTEEEVHRKVRTAIEAECSDWAKGGDRNLRAIGDYIAGEGKTIEDYYDWHEKLHEFDGTPWVTESEHSIEIR